MKNQKKNKKKKRKKHEQKKGMEPKEIFKLCILRVGYAEECQY